MFDASEKSYLPAGIAALIFSVLFPSYWLWFMSSGLYLDFGAQPPSRLGLDYFIWLILGLLTLYVYLCLKSALMERHTYSKLTWPIYLAIGSTAFVYGGPALVELGLVMLSGAMSDSSMKALLGVITAMFFGGMVIQGVVDILISITLLWDSQDLPDALRIFAIVTLISGVFGVTVIAGIATLITVPISMLVLAFYFLRHPQAIEVV